MSNTDKRYILASEVKGWGIAGKELESKADTAIKTPTLDDCFICNQTINWFKPDVLPNYSCRLLVVTSFSGKYCIENVDYSIINGTPTFDDGSEDEYPFNNLLSNILLWAHFPSINEVMLEFNKQEYNALPHAV